MIPNGEMVVNIDFRKFEKWIFASFAARASALARSYRTLLAKNDRAFGTREKGADRATSPEWLPPVPPRVPLPRVLAVAARQEANQRRTWRPPRGETDLLPAAKPNTPPARMKMPVVFSIVFRAVVILIKRYMVISGERRSARITVISIGRAFPAR